MPRNALEFTAFKAGYRADHAIDLTQPPFDADAESWEHPTDYTACLALADAARDAAIDAIRYRSVRDPGRRHNIALLACTAFTGDQPIEYRTWRLSFSPSGINALCDWPEQRIGFPLAMFANDPRIDK